jgi:hypothetical protein
MATRKWQDVSRSEFVRDWNDGLTFTELCEKHGITKDQAIRLRDVFECKKRMDRRLRKRPPNSKDPTPDEIQSRCAVFRMHWTPREERWRRRWVPEWNVPCCSLNGMKTPRRPSTSYTWMRPVELSQEVPVEVFESIGRTVNYKLVKLAETDESTRFPALLYE